MPYLDYHQSNGYLLPPYLEELIPVDHVARVLKKLFKQVVQICQRLGMVSLGLVAIDGTKVKASASDYGAKTKDALKKARRFIASVKKIVEPVFGQVKFNLGFRRFRLMGSGKAGGEWTLVYLVHNIKKIYAKIMAKGGELDSLTRELEAVYNPA